MGIVLRLRLVGDDAQKYLPIAKAHLAAINARSNASFVRNLLEYPDATIEVVRGTVVDQINITQGIDGFYSLGFVDTAYKIVGSPTARGTFSKRGDAGTETFNFPALPFYGKGYGVVPRSAGIGTTLDFDGKNCPAVQATLSLTRDGKKLTDLYSIVANGAFGEGAAIFFQGGVWWKDADTFRFAAGLNFMAVGGDGQHRSAFIVDDKDTQTVGDTLNLTGQLTVAPLVTRMGPGQILMMHRFLRPPYTGSSVDPTTVPGLAFSFTTDAGRTWTPAPDPLTTGDMFNDFNSVIAVVPADVAHAADFNKAVELATVAAFMQTPTRAIVIALVPYATDLGGGFFDLKGRVRLGWCDVADNFALHTAVTLYDGNLDDCDTFMGGGGIGIKEGALLFTRPITGTEWDEPRQVLFTSDGTSFVVQATMPFANNKTGLVSATDPKTLICPMYDGEHALYQSTDQAKTWKHRAVIYKGAPAPDPADMDLSLQRFGQVTFLRDNGAPANLTPATPWVSDARIASPT